MTFWSVDWASIEHGLHRVRHAAIGPVVTVSTAILPLALAQSISYNCSEFILVPLTNILPKKKRDDKGVESVVRAVRSSLTR